MNINDTIELSPDAQSVLYLIAVGLGPMHSPNPGETLNEIIDAGLIVRQRTGNLTFTARGEKLIKEQNWT